MSVNCKWISTSKSNHTFTATIDNFC